MRWLWVLCVASCGFTDLDLDQDGFTVAQGDCDDLSLSISPNAQEVPYDGVDQDCDGSDLVDLDRDGFAALVAGGDDCNDTDPRARPGAWERFGDSQDQDCDGVDAGTAGPWAKISVGAGFACGLNAERDSVSCWGLRQERSLASAPPDTWIDVSAGGSHACATNVDGETVCWGEPPGIHKELRQVDAGLGRTCGLDPRGDLQCWGAGFSELAGPFTDVALADSFSGIVLWTCLTADEGIRCLDQRGEDANPLVQVPGSWTDLAVGAGFVCALDDRRVASCWGAIGAPPEDALVTLAAGEDFACGLDPSGAVHCWGNMDAPAGSYQGLSAGGGTACAWTAEGSVSCWGEPLTDLD